jgi:hypothetical protein
LEIEVSSVRIAGSLLMIDQRMPARVRDLT